MNVNKYARVTESGPTIESDKDIMVTNEPDYNRKKYISYSERSDIYENGICRARTFNRL